MSRLTIRLLGPFEVVLDNQPVTGFESDKVRALLAYLATESEQAHRREALAGLLWPEMAESQARMNLRGALADLRQAINDHHAEPSFLEITRQSIQFNNDSDSLVDVHEFDILTNSGSVREQGVLQLEEAVNLYGGEFLAGFSIVDSAGFEEWATVTREQSTRYMLSTLDRLSTHHQEAADYQTAIGFARRHVELEPTAEGAHRKLIQLLALNGQNAAAIDQFETYREMLDSELGVEPTDETMELVSRIKSGELRAEARPHAERSIRGYELRDQIGEGNFGTVFRAYQPLVDREVAVKVIQQDFANEPEFIRRFEAEAQLVARVEHLHIAPLYDYWREPAGAYLVMRLFQAGSLKESLQEGPWSPADTAQLVDQITAALAAAHQKQVVHRDVKPANILLDGDRNAYLSDFGIAKALDWSTDLDPVEGITGSPAYIAPEQILNAPITPLTDIYSMGVVLYELLSGEHPFPTRSVGELLNMHLKEPLPLVSEGRVDLPPAVDEVIQQATAKRPEERFTEATDLAHAFRTAIKASAKPFVLPDPVNPYKGLRAFDEADAGEFYGREELTERLLSHLQKANLLAVVGPSGSGKSSVVKAGLIPALRKGKISGSEDWFVVDVDLESHPLENLMAALRGIAISSSGELLSQLTQESAEGLQVLRELLPDPQAKLLLVIDQFENLFTQVQDPVEQDEFIEVLAGALIDRDSPLKVILTLRADFYDRPLRYPQFGELMHQHTEVALPLSPEQIERAIMGPLENTDLQPPGELAAAIIGDVANQPGALPLMQYALTELFEQRVDGGMTLDAYRKIGGVSGALGRRAEEIYGSLTGEEQNAARQLYLRLVQLGEGTQPTRNRVLRPELTELENYGKSIETVIDLFGKHRLLTFDRDPETRAPTVELAHESLLREWPRFASWIVESREGLVLHQQLLQAAEEWDQLKREPGYLLRGTRLDRFEDWARRTDLALGHQERDFLDLSLAEREIREAAEADRQAKEAALERRAYSRLRALVAVLSIAVVGALALSAVALRAQRNAEQETAARSTQQVIAETESEGRATQQFIAEMEAEARATQQTLAELSAEEALSQARIATSRELAGAALANLEVDPERSILLALEAADVTRAHNGTVLPEVIEALHHALQRMRVILTLEPAGAAAYSLDGSKIASAGPDEFARIWDANSGELIQTLAGHSDQVVNAAFSPGGGRLVTASADGTAKVWELSTGEVIHTLDRHNDGLVSPAYSPDGTRIVTTSFDGTARMWDAESGEQQLILVHSGPTLGPHFNPDGSLVAIADDSAVVARIWDTSTGEEVLTLTGHTEGLNEVAFSPDGLHLATASSDFTIKLWDAQSGEELKTLDGHTGWVFTVEFTPDAKQLISGSQDGTVRVWDIDSGRELLTLAGHAGGVGEVSVSPSGEFVVSAGEDGTAKVWDISPEGGRDWLTLAGHDDVVLDVDISSDGTRAATASWDHTAKVWDLTSGDLLLNLQGHTDQVGGVAFSPDGLLLGTAGYDGSARIWNAISGEQLGILLGHQGPVTGIAFSPDGDLLATGALDGTAKLWDWDSGEEIHTLTGHEDWVFRVAFSPDGSQLATGSWDGSAKLWNVASGEELSTIVGHAAPVTSVAYNPIGTHLATGSFDAKPRIWNLDAILDSSADADLETHDELIGHTGIVWDAVFSPDGGTIASASFDNTVKIWDSTTGEELLTFSAPSAIAFANVAFSPDGRLLAASSGDGTVRIFVLPPNDLIELAHERVTRTLTETECQQYLHLDSCSDNR